MIILVMGRNGSGKSVFSEGLAARLEKPRYYIATMRPQGGEGAARVQKHLIQRAGLGFVTLELPHSIGGADIPANALVLVEDIANLLANAIFEKGQSEAEVFEDIMLLCRRVNYVIAVTVNEFDDGDYNRETRLYIRAVKRLNRLLCEHADAVVVMEGGRPVFRKGAPDEIV